MNVTRGKRCTGGAWITVFAMMVVVAPILLLQPQDRHRQSFKHKTTFTVLAFQPQRRSTRSSRQSHRSRPKPCSIPTKAWECLTNDQASPLFVSSPSPDPSPLTAMSSSSSSSSQLSHPTDDLKERMETTATHDNDLRRDIALLRQQAMERLELLEHQMEEFQAHKEQQHHEDLEKKKRLALSLDSMEGERISIHSQNHHKNNASGNVKSTKKIPSSASTTIPTIAPHAPSSSAAKAKPSTSPPTQDIPQDPFHHAPVHLLDGTRWKVAYDIGREYGTWMPPEWGASGSRLRFQVVLDFTNETTSSTDDFFTLLGAVAGSANTGGAASSTATTTTTTGALVKKCRIVEAFCYPHGVGSSSIGRRTLPVAPEGVFQVVQGQGPAGTDLVRFYIQLYQPISYEDCDVHVPAGRLYGTCGYFANTPHSHACKERLGQQLQQLTHHYEELLNEGRMDTQLFSMDQIRRMKEQWDLRRQIEAVNKQLQAARARDPERAQLRISKRGDIALTKDGGVCCKIHQGVAVEYRILGRMELGSLDITDHSQEQQEEDRHHRTNNVLHP